MTRYVILTETAAVISFATPAFADVGLRFYAGPIVGYDHVALSVDGVGSGKDDGIMYGGTIGVDAKVGQNGTIGLEAELADSSVGASVNGVLVAGNGHDVATAAPLLGKSDC